MSEENFNKKTNMKQEGVFIEPKRDSDEERKKKLEEMDRYFEKETSESKTEQLSEMTKETYLEKRSELLLINPTFVFELDKKFGMNDVDTSENVLEFKPREEKQEGGFPKMNLVDPREDDGGVIPGDEGMADVNEMGINMDKDRALEEIDEYKNGEAPDFKLGNLQGEEIDDEK